MNLSSVSYHVQTNNQQQQNQVKVIALTMNILQNVALIKESNHVYTFYIFKFIEFILFSHK